MADKIAGGPAEVKLFGKWTYDDVEVGGLSSTQAAGLVACCVPMPGPGAAGWRCTP